MGDEKLEIDDYRYFYTYAIVEKIKHDVQRPVFNTHTITTIVIKLSILLFSLGNDFHFAKIYESRSRRLVHTLQ